MPALDEKSKREYRAKRFESMTKYNVLRAQPRIVEIIKSALKQNLDEDFEKVGKHSQPPDPNGRLIVFVLGGLSFTEIAAV
jgi:hypothetical protein